MMMNGKMIKKGKGIYYYNNCNQYEGEWKNDEIKKLNNYIICENNIKKRHNKKTNSNIKFL